MHTANIFAIIFTMISISCWGIDSISGNDPAYRNVCLKAATDPLYFESFRNSGDYSRVVEVGAGGLFAHYLRQKASQEVLNKLSIFEKLDEIGSPPVELYPQIGTFTGTTLRYIVIANHITRLFSLSDDAVIAEIGAGFGGQCFVFSQLQPFSHYYIYDLPEVEKLITKTLEFLQVDKATCIPFEDGLPENSIDLVISNYAFSECTKEIQLEYFEKVIQKSRRGYVIYNQITARVFKLDYLSPDEFISLLESAGKKPQIYAEPVATAEDNLLIVWGMDEAIKKAAINSPD